MYSKVKHIFFDLDDTLWDFEKNSSSVLRQIFSEFELEQKLNTNFISFYTTYKEVNNEFWKKYNKGIIDKQHLRNNRFNETFKKFNYNNYTENLEVTELYIARSPFGTHLKDGCLELLEHLKEKYKLHIITNGFKEIQNIKLDNCGLKIYFDQIIISEEHQVNKPNEKIFRISETLAGCHKNECLMIGDNFESDIEGAHAAGWKTIWLNDKKQDVEFHQIQELKELKLHL